MLTDGSPSREGDEDKTERSINELIAIHDRRMESILYAVEEGRRSAAGQVEDTGFGFRRRWQQGLDPAEVAAALNSLKQRLEDLHDQAKMALRSRNFVEYNEVTNTVRDLIEAKKDLAEGLDHKRYWQYPAGYILSLRPVIETFFEPLPPDLVAALPQAVVKVWGASKHGPGADSPPAPKS